MEAAPAPVSQTAFGAVGVGIGSADLGRHPNHHHNHHSNHHIPPHRAPLNHLNHNNNHVPHYQPVPGKPREFGLHAPRMRAPAPRPIHVSVAPAASDTPQLPPLVISPRWDSPGNNAPYVAKPFALAPSSRSSSPHGDRPSDVPFAPFQPYSRSATPSSIRIPSSMSERPDPQTPQSPTGPIHPFAPGMDFTVENFSRPRNLSQKKQQPTALDFLSPRNSDSPIDPLLDSMSLHTMGMRSRGPSVSSVTTASTFASAPLPRSHDLRERHGGRDVPTVKPPPASPPAGSRDSGQLMREAPWIVESGVDGTSNRRSQLTAGAGPGFVTPRERASLLVKSGLLGALVPPHDELSVEDVMSLYETGFHDTEPEDHDTSDSRPQTAWSAPNRASRSMLAPSPMEVSSRLSIMSMAPRTNDDEDDGYEPETEAVLAAYQRDSRFPRQSQVQRLSQLQQRFSQLRSDDHEDMDVKRDSGKSFESEVPAMPRAHKIVTEDPNSRDRYGFKKENQYITQAQYDQWNVGYEPYLDRRRKKWVAYLKENSLMTSRPNRFPPRNNKTKRFVRKGIPPDWRGAAWFYYAGGPAVLSKNPGVYARLQQQEAKEIDIEAIERDLHRTFPDNVKFKPPPGSDPSSCPDSPDGDLHRQQLPVGGSEIPIISSLRRVLLAFSIHNPRIGYCQSLNFLAGLLLLFVESEEHAFWLLNIITKDFLPGTHELSLEGSKVDLGVLMTSLHESMPAVWAKIAGDMDAEPAPRPQTGKSTKRARVRRRDVAPPTGRLPPITLCMTAWFMSCFIGTLPMETTLRVWDVLFYEGSKTLFRIALAIFKLGENEIESMLDPMEMFSVVQTIPRKMLDANGLMEACFKRRNGFGHLSQETTDSRRRERRAQVQMEKDAPYDGTGDGEGSVRNSKGSMFGRKKKAVDAGMRRPIDE